MLYCLLLLLLLKLLMQASCNGLAWSWRRGELGRVTWSFGTDIKPNSA